MKELGDALDDVESYLTRFVAYPSEHARVAHVLWVGHTHFMHLWESTPRIAFLSPEPGSGKSRALEVTEPLVPRPVHAVNVSAPYLFRRVADPEGLPTVLYDEVDTVFGPRARENEEIRGLLNAGHRRGAKAGRCVTRGNNIETEDFDAYCSVALAGLGRLPDTILTRSVVVRMRKRRRDEHVESWRGRLHEPEGQVVRDRLAELAAMVTAIEEWPEMPDGVEDRNADVWEALITVADLAGGEWPQRARVAAVALVADAQRDDAGSLGVRLLRDLRTIFGGEDRLTTAEILSRLHAREEMPWGSLREGPLDPRGLSRLVADYDVKPKSLRIGSRVQKGYTAADLWDAWERYAPLCSEEPVTPATPATPVRIDPAPRPARCLICTRSVAPGRTASGLRTCTDCAERIGVRHLHVV